MALSDLVKLTEKKFKKLHKDTEINGYIASEAPPLVGLELDNPMLEFLLDRRILALGRCGLVYGQKGNAKTSLFFDFAKLFQAHGGDVIWVETENAADLDYAKKQGVDLDKMFVTHPKSLNEALDYITDIVENMPKAYPDGDTPVLICLDSIAGAPTEYELQDKIAIADTKVGEHAKLMSNFYGRIIEPLANEKCFLLALNQLKHAIPKPGEMTFGGPKEALKGGDAAGFHSTFQFKMSKLGEIEIIDSHGANRKAGSRHKIEVKRNKLGREGKSQVAEFDLYIDGGIDWYSALVRKLGASYQGLVTKNGGWYNWNVANCKLADGTEIDIQEKFREADLAKILKNSTDAKNLCRTAFGIPELDRQEDIAKIEAERKTKRQKRKNKLDDEDLSENTIIKFEDEI